MKKGNFITAGVFALFAVLVILQSMSFPAGKDGIPGPGFFPIAIAILMLLAAASLTITTLRMKPEEDTAIGMLSDDNKRVYVCMAILVLYLLVMPYVGFCTTSFVLLFGLIKWFGNYRLPSCALLSAAVVVPLFLVFSYVLNVPLRFGLLI